MQTTPWSNSQTFLPPQKKPISHSPQPLATTNLISALFFSSSSSGILTVCMLVGSVVSCGPLRHYSFFFIPFYFCFSDWIISLDPFEVHLLFILSVEISCQTPVVNFSFQLLFFSSIIFLWFLLMNSLIDIPYLIKYCSYGFWFICCLYTSSLLKRRSFRVSSWPSLP